MTFWNTSTGESAIDGKTEYEAGGGFIIIPDNSNVQAVIKDSGIDEYEGSKFYFVEWSVLKPDAAAGARIKQKFYLFPDSPKPNTKDAAKDRDKAMKQLLVIDANAGGRLATLSGPPTDQNMKVALIGKIMVVKVKEWYMDNKSGNWIAGVFPKTKEIGLTGEIRAKEVAQKPADDWSSPSGGGFGDVNASAWGDDLGDDIPFK